MTLDLMEYTACASAPDLFHKDDITKFSPAYILVQGTRNQLPVLPLSFPRHR